MQSGREVAQKPSAGCSGGAGEWSVNTVTISGLRKSGVLHSPITARDRKGGAGRWWDSVQPVLENCSTYYSAGVLERWISSEILLAYVITNFELGKSGSFARCAKLLLRERHKE